MSSPTRRSFLTKSAGVALGGLTTGVFGGVVACKREPAASGAHVSAENVVAEPTASAAADAHPGYYLNLRGPDGYTGREQDPAVLMDVYDDFELVRTDLATYEEVAVPVPFPAHGIAASPLHPGLAVLVEKWAPNACTVDLEAGRVIAHVVGQPFREFVGHAEFAPDGRRVFVSEGDFTPGAADHARGIIGVRNVRTLELLEELPSHGENPHEILLLSDRTTLAVCNQGTIMRPTPTRSNLAFVDTRDGSLVEQVPVPRNDLVVAHMRVLANDDVVLVTKSPDSDTTPCTVYVRQGGGGLEALPVPDELVGAFAGEILSLDVDEQRQRVGVTCPAGGTIAFWDLREKRFLRAHRVARPLAIALSEDASFYVVSGLELGALAIDADSLEVVDALLPDAVAAMRFSAPHSTVVA